MKHNKQNELLRILSDASQSIPSAALAGMLGVSERTIRNYVKDLNESGEASILASREGYRLQEVFWQPGSGLLRKMRGGLADTVRFADRQGRGQCLR